MITRPLLSMSVGSPKLATSTGYEIVSNAAPYDAYSASVKPPAGFDVSARTIACSPTATTRPVRSCRTEQKPSPPLLLVFSVILSPILGTTTPSSAELPPAERRAYHALATAARD